MSTRRKAMVRNKRRTIKRGGGGAAFRDGEETDLHPYNQDFLMKLEKEENEKLEEKKRLEDSLPPFAKNQELSFEEYKREALKIGHPAYSILVNTTEHISSIEDELAKLRTRFNPNKSVLTSNGLVFSLTNQGVQCYGNALWKMLEDTNGFKGRVSNCPGNDDPVVENMQILLFLLESIKLDEYGKAVIDFTEDIQTEIEERTKMFSTNLFLERQMQDPIELFHKLFKNPNLTDSVFEGFGLLDQYDRHEIVGYVQVAAKNTKTSVQTYIDEVIPSKYVLLESNNVLVVYISRAGYTGERNSTPVEINEVIILVNGKTYALKSFCSHVGSSSVKTGHYVADCNLDGVYFRFDDGRMPVKLTPNLENNTNVSTLIYELVDEAPAPAPGIATPLAVAESKAPGKKPDAARHVSGDDSVVNAFREMHNKYAENLFQAKDHDVAQKLQSQLLEAEDRRVAEQLQSQFDTEYGGGASRKRPNKNKKNKRIKRNTKKVKK